MCFVPLSAQCIVPLDVAKSNAKVFDADELQERCAR
jgi:hypothetical protein